VVEFVEIDVDGAAVRIGLTVKRDPQALNAGGQWTAEGKLPTWATPRAVISIRGSGRDRASAIREAVARANEGIARYEHVRERHAR
jgi:hypothetical protein